MPTPTRTFAHRSFYTWDHSTNWELAQTGQRTGSCHEPYDKPPDGFLADYTKLINFMGRVKMNHLIIWGALRDNHGGVEARAWASTVTAASITKECMSSV